MTLRKVFKSSLWAPSVKSEINSDLAKTLESESLLRDEGRSFVQERASEQIFKIGSEILGLKIFNIGSDRTRV